MTKEEKPRFLVQAIARELNGGRQRGSMKLLSALSDLSEDSLRVLKRNAESAGHRQISRTRGLHLAMLIAVHRLNVLPQVMKEADSILDQWEVDYPGSVLPRFTIRQNKK